MFTLADICHIAIQIETNGEESYRKASLATKDTEFAKLFTQMADDEKKHAKWFESINADKELTEEQREMEAVGKSILQEMVGDKTFSLEGEHLHKITDLDEVLHKSWGFEEDTILFYEMLSGFIDDEETLIQLKSIIAEEKSHFEGLKAMADKLMTEA